MGPFPGLGKPPGEVNDYPLSYIAIQWQSSPELLSSIYLKNSKTYSILFYVLLKYGSVVKNSPVMQKPQETRGRFLGWGDPLEKEMATHFSILAWRIPRTEEPGGLQSCPKGRKERDTTEHAFFKGLGLGEGWFGVENGLNLGLSWCFGMEIVLGLALELELWWIRALEFGSGEDWDAVEIKMEFGYGGAWD